MGAKPTGTKTADGALELRRDFALDPRELWHYLVDPTGTALWFGPWHGDPGSGSVEVVLSVEEGAPTQQVDILHCDPQGLELTVRTGEGEGAWRLELAITETHGGSQLTFRMPGLDPAMAGSVGPGWDFYLDRLASAAGGGDPSDLLFEPDYYPALKDYYEALFLPDKPAD